MPKSIWSQNCWPIISHNASFILGSKAQSKMPSVCMDFSVAMMCIWPSITRSPLLHIVNWKMCLCVQCWIAHLLEFGFTVGVLIGSDGWKKKMWLCVFRWCLHMSLESLWESWNSLNCWLINQNHVLGTPMTPWRQSKETLKTPSR